MVDAIVTPLQMWDRIALLSGGFTVGLKHLTQQGEFVEAVAYETELHVIVEDEVTVFKNGTWLDHRRTAETSNLPTDLKRVLFRLAGAMTLTEFVEIVARTFDVTPTSAKEVAGPGRQNLNCFVQVRGAEFYVRHVDGTGWHVAVEVQDKQNYRVGGFGVDGRKTLPEALERLREIATDWRTIVNNVLEVLG